ncbi:hypothetical protein [Sorangium sp. So ce1153]|uniref:hypothetical protein n=1 Tax=Sorangium sp. So ce1153 TaxID=3133333 RepID=UPI003F5FB576
MRAFAARRNGGPPRRARDRLRPGAPSGSADRLRRPRVAACETHLAAWSAVPIDASHRIKSIVMFTDIPKERLK